MDGSYGTGQQHEYIKHPAYSTTPQNYIRAFQLLQNDLITLFESIEPADQTSRHIRFASMSCSCVHAWS